MKIYVDVVFFINFMFDLLLLLSVGIERKIIPKFYRFLLGAFCGSLSFFFLLFSLSSITLFFLKFLISIFMIVITFSFRNKTFFWQNLKSLYGNSIILGGLMYVLNIQFSYRQQGFIFFHDGTSINLIIIIIASPIVFYLYCKQKKQLQHQQMLLHQVKIKYKETELIVQGFLDTGNAICDPYKKRSIIILNDHRFQPTIEEAILVPYKTVGHHGLLRCIVPDELMVDDHYISTHRYLIGFSEEIINIHGSNCILPSCLLEEE